MLLRHMHMQSAQHFSVSRSDRALCSVHDVERKYYADGEDAYCMRKTFKPGHESKGKESRAIKSI